MLLSIRIDGIYAGITEIHKTTARIMGVEDIGVITSVGDRYKQFLGKIKKENSIITSTFGTRNKQLVDRELVRQYSDNDIDAVMQIWLDTNIQAHHFIPSDYWRANCNMVREMLPHAETYVHEDDYTKQIACISVSWGHITQLYQLFHCYNFLFHIKSSFSIIIH